MSLLYPDLGAACSAPSCRRHDLLPALCDGCSLPFCAEHLERAVHDCSLGASSALRCSDCGGALPLAPGVTDSAAVAAAAAEHATACPAKAGREHRCGLPGCSGSHIVLVLCRACGGSFCIPHRLPEDHACSSVRDPTTHRRTAPGALTRELAARPLWEWEFLNSPSTDEGDAALAHAVRFGLRVFFAPELRLRPRYMYFNMKWKVGRVLDSICRAADVPNRNNSGTGGPQLRLFLLTRSCPELPSTASLSDLGSEPDSDFHGFKSGSGVMLRAAASLPPRIVEEVPRWLVQLQRQSRGGVAAALRERIVGTREVRRDPWNPRPAGAEPADEPPADANWVDLMDDRSGAAAAADALRRSAPSFGAVLAMSWLLLLFVIGACDPH
eukprot:TRINITY_DN12085_c0_g1_i1.p1 TRINITY_DN12085_c0_g1~~TRINITY_DN12085_c0_g1_i1.p1  ORF type:complete len:403 (+),score=99.82 TRINITY_DN12085_c0_g1_i1:59-1210(+)